MSVTAEPLGGKPFGKTQFWEKPPESEDGARVAREAGGAKSGAGNRHRAKLDQSRLPAIAIVCIIFVYTHATGRPHPRPAISYVNRYIHIRGIYSWSTVSREFHPPPAAAVSTLSADARRPHVEQTPFLSKQSEMSPRHAIQDPWLHVGTSGDLRLLPPLTPQTRSSIAMRFKCERGEQIRAVKRIRGA